MTEPFWKRKTLEEMTPTEWESLCDRCGLCCLHKVEYQETGDVHYTCVSCTLLDTETGLCSDYTHRFERVPHCLAVTPHTARTSTWLPTSCAYRRLAQGKDLPAWHPLVTGTFESVEAAGVGAKGKVISEDDIDPAALEDYISDWIARADDGCE